jgi:hypothetical protein
MIRLDGPPDRMGTRAKAGHEQTFEAAGGG